MPPLSMLLARVTSLDHTSNCHLRRPSTPQWTRPVWMPTRILTFTPITSRTNLHIFEIIKRCIAKMWDRNAIAQHTRQITNDQRPFVGRSFFRGSFRYFFQSIFFDSDIFHSSFRSIFYTIVFFFSDRFSTFFAIVWTEGVRDARLKSHKIFHFPETYPERAKWNARNGQCL